MLSLSAIREQKTSLTRIVADAQAKIADLEIAERYVRRFGQTTEDTRPTVDEIDDLLGPVELTPLNTAPQPDNRRPVTTKSLMLSVLRDAPSVWMTSDELRDRVTALKGEDVPMGTIGPTLSNMKNEGVIVREGFKVALAERHHENRASDGNQAEDALDAEEAPTSSNESQSVEDLLG